MSVTDRVLDALKAAVLLESRVATLADDVSDLSREVRSIDRRLVRVEALIEFGAKSGASGRPPAIEDKR